MGRANARGGSEDVAALASAEAERVAAVKEAALCTMQRDAALAALVTMQELYGEPHERIPSIAELVDTQNHSTAMQSATALREETAKLRGQLTKLRQAEAASRDSQRAHLQSLARACTQLCHAVLPPHENRSEREAQRAAEGLRREVLSLCDGVRRDVG